MTNVVQFVPLLIVGLMVIFAVWVFGTIMNKIGRSRSWGVLWIVPIANIGLLCWLAFSEWPIEKELRRLREKQAS